MIYLHINWQEYKGYYSGICKEIPRFIVSHTGNYDDFVKYIELEYDKGFDREPTRKFLQNMANAKYCLSPHGHTPDCYRHWEAMYVNCIPVTLKHKYLEPFYDMPILFLDSWDQLTEKLLIDSYDELSKRSRDKLNIEYWLDMLENKGN